LRENLTSSSDGEGLETGRCARRRRASPLPGNSVFKEWKSYANLHQFDTANAHIAEGLIWAGLCAAVLKRFLAHAAQRVGKGTAMSTRRVAMCAHHILHDVVTALLDGFGLLGPLRRGLTYLLENARRANVQRDRRTGRLRAGLTTVPAVK